MKQAYHQPARVGEVALPLVVDRGYLQKIIDLLRPTSQPMRCFWCHGPLTGPTCPVCDEGSV